MDKGIKWFYKPTWLSINVAWIKCTKTTIMQYLSHVQNQPRFAFYAQLLMDMSWNNLLVWLDWVKHDHSKNTSCHKTECSLYTQHVQTIDLWHSR